MFRIDVANYMKIKIQNIVIGVSLLILMASCKSESPALPYSYESNPQYTWGYVQFYGDYYKNYQNLNNVLSISLFSKGLSINSDEQLVGTGQFLFLEDVFSAPADTMLRQGTYTIAETGVPFTFFSGKEFKNNNETKPSGAYIYYIEADASKSKLQYITEGSFTVSIQNDTIYSVTCNFVTADKKELKGNFKGVLPHYDESAKTPTSQSVRMENLRGLPVSFIRAPK